MGALIILLSWIVTTTIAGRLQRLTQSLGEWTTRDELRTELSRLNRGYREVKATLDRLDSLASELRPSSIFSKFGSGAIRADLQEQYALTQSLANSFIEHVSIQDELRSCRELASVGRLDATLTRELLQEVDVATATVDSFNQRLHVWDRSRATASELMTRSPGPGTTVDPSQALEDFRVATAAFVREGAALTEQIIEHRVNLEAIRSRALTALFSKLNRLRRAAKVSERFAWILYLAGSAMVVGGQLADLG